MIYHNKKQILNNKIMKKVKDVGKEKAVLTAEMQRLAKFIKD